MRLALHLTILALASSCGAAAPTTTTVPTDEGTEDAREGRDVEPAPQTGRVTITVVGTNDLHGHVRALPLLAGHLENLRAAREADGGAVLLVDAGDMFQGTIESNLVEGASVIVGMNALRYAASTVGNHEFDYGPVGDAVVPAGDGTDARGALIARAEEATFPILTANIRDRATHRRVEWSRNMPPTLLTELAGVKVGIVGISTEETLRTTISGNVRDLEMAPLDETIRERANELRAAGAEIVIVSAHAGGKCHAFEDARDLAECEDDQEIFGVVRALPEGFVDLVVAGHTHAGVAHWVNGIPVIESFAYGVAFGRVDFVFDRATREIADTTVFPPRFVCGERSDQFDTCQPGEYEGGPVVRRDDVARALEPYVARAREVESRSLGVEVTATMPDDFTHESALGNLLADLVREGVEGADVGLMNGGGIRAPLPEGEVTYGEMYRVFPFDNRFAKVRLTGAELRALIDRALDSTRSALLLSGIRARARCRGGARVIDVTRENGRRVRDDETLLVAMSDFLATGGDGVLAAANAEGRVEIDDGAPMRERLVSLLAELGRVSPDRYFDPRRPRLAFPGERPMTCAGGSAMSRTAPRAP
jgi:5'-nucleotidase